MHLYLVYLYSHQAPGILNIMKPIKDSPTLTALHHSLLFLHVEELRELATQLNIPARGKKIILITRIIHFLTTGEIITQPPYPKFSCPQRGSVYPLVPTTLMLKGAYKNDLETRLFFKKLIGEHFHFTAFGIDWLEEQWRAGNPPTYEAFARMWQDEYKRRKVNPAAPKEEWAYINFTQRYLVDNPDATPQAIRAAWKQERLKHKKLVDAFIATIR